MAQVNMNCQHKYTKEFTSLGE